MFTKWTEAGWRKDFLFKVALNAHKQKVSIYRAEDDALYTFSKTTATCPACLQSENKSKKKDKED